MHFFAQFKNVYFRDVCMEKNSALIVQQETEKSYLISSSRLMLSNNI